MVDPYPSIVAGNRTRVPNLGVVQLPSLTDLCVGVPTGGISLPCSAAVSS
jgi:hypothetical protein